MPGVIMNQQEESRNCNNAAHIMGGIILAGIGVLFLLINLDILPGIDVVWPAIIIIVGLALIVRNLTERKKDNNN